MRMSLRRIAQKCSLLSQNHQCSRYFVRFKKSPPPAVMEKYLEPEMHTNFSSKVTLVSQQESDHIFITKYSGLGFTLQDSSKLAGSSIFFPRKVMRWKVNNYHDINEESLSLFAMLTPSLDLLIIGTGRKKRELSKETVKYLRKNKVNFEVFSSDQAISAFNFQNNDQRWVAAAVVPPEGSENQILRKYVKNVYNDILDSTDFVYREEKELPQIDGGPDSNTEIKKLQNQETSDTAIESVSKGSDLDSNKDKTEELMIETEEKVIAPPLGQSVNYLSSDAYEVYEGPVIKTRD